MVVAQTAGAALPVVKAGFIAHRCPEQSDEAPGTGIAERPQEAVRDQEGCFGEHGASSSILGRKQETRRATVGFGDDPQVFALAGLVGTQQPTAFTQGDLVLLVVVPVEVFAPVPVDVAAKELARRLT